MKKLRGGEEYERCWSCYTGTLSRDLLGDRVLAVLQEEISSIKLEFVAVV